MEQKRAEYDNVVVTDGLELQKVFDSVRRNTPPTASSNSLSDEEERDLETAPATGLEDSSSNSLEDESSKNVVEETLANSGSQVVEDKDNSHDVESKELSNNKRRLTPKNDRGSKYPHDIRTNQNYEQKERLNIDSERSKDQRHGTRDSLARDGKNKLAQTAQQSKTAELESSNAGYAVPDSNSSASTPPPYILKVKNTPARAELDDIYFLCKFFLSFLSNKNQIKSLNVVFNEKRFWWKVIFQVLLSVTNIQILRFLICESRP